MNIDWRIKFERKQLYDIDILAQEKRKRRNFHMEDEKKQLQQQIQLCRRSKSRLQNL